FLPLVKGLSGQPRDDDYCRSGGFALTFRPHPFQLRLRRLGADSVQFADLAGDHGRDGAQDDADGALRADFDGRVVDAGPIPAPAPGPPHDHVAAPGFGENRNADDVAPEQARAAQVIRPDLELLDRPLVGVRRDDAGLFVLRLFAHMTPFRWLVMFGSGMLCKDEKTATPKWLIEALASVVNTLSRAFAFTRPAADRRRP